MINPKDFSELLKEKEPHFNTLGRKHQVRLVEDINKLLEGKNRHNHIDRWKYAGSQYLSSQYLKKRYGGKGGHYKTVIRPYLDCIDESYYFVPFGRGKGFTKKYKVTDWVIKSAQDYFSDTTPTDLYRIENDEIGKITDIPISGIYPIGYDGGKMKTKVYLPPVVSPNIDMLDHYIDTISHYTHFREWNRLNILFQLQGIRKLLNNTLIPNSLLQIYQESRTGRLVPMEGYSFHLLNTPKKIRQILFSDMNLYYYDMENSHLSLFYQLSKDLGYECNSIKYYLDNKELVRNEWEERYGVKMKKIKRYTLSWVYGNGMNVGEWNPFYMDLGIDRLMEIKNDDELLKGIYAETVKGRNIILADTPTEGIGKNKVLKNVWGNELPLFENGKRTPKRRQLVHLLFGLESKIMEIVNRVMDPDMVVLIYDGWISNKLDVSFLQNEVKSKLDLDIRFDEELIDPPPLEFLV